MNDECIHAVTSSGEHRVAEINDDRGELIADNSSQGMEIVHSGIGTVTIKDIEIAKASSSCVFTYGVSPPPKDIFLFARDSKVPIISFQSIPHMVEILNGESVELESGRRNENQL